MEKEKKLSKYAYGGIAGKDYVPYVTDGEKKGGSVAILIIGLILAALFAVRRRITIGCNSKLKSRLTPIRPRGLACNCTFLSA